MLDKNNIQNKNSNNLDENEKFKDNYEDNYEDLKEEFEIETPNYLKEIYYWAYLNPKNVPLLDNMFVYNLILFGNGYKLMNEYLLEIKEGINMLQIAHVYGNITQKIAEKIGSNGKLDLIDVADIQIARAKEKLKKYDNVEIWKQDASTMIFRKYDVIGVYFLLHEVPDSVKKRIVNNVLNSIEESKGKAVFIDYHEPNFFNPVKPILSLVNTFLEPFANSMWHQEIYDFAKNTKKFNWEKKTIFGGVYQKVVVTLK